MSLYFFGPREHASLCRQRGGHPPLLCVCRPLDLLPAAAGDEWIDVASTRIGRAFFRRIDIELPTADDAETGGAGMVLDSP